ncbi:MAG: hypothetical protein PHS29_00570 [Candidatus Pacebacteria bacterium]|nr:hypothetical protein [Candidatus Paceibacterota bacterium]
MIAETISFVKRHQKDIMLIVGVILISLFSFAAGYITAKQQKEEPFIIENILENE